MFHADVNAIRKAREFSLGFLFACKSRLRGMGSSSLINFQCLLMYKLLLPAALVENLWPNGKSKEIN